MQARCMAEVSDPLTTQLGAPLKGRLERAERVHCSLGGDLCRPKMLRYSRHLQGRRYGRLGQEDAGVEEGLACDEMGRERGVCHMARLLLLEKPDGRQQADNLAQLADRNPCQVGQVLCRYAQLERDACKDLELCKPLEACKNLSL